MGHVMAGAALLIALLALLTAVAALVIGVLQVTGTLRFSKKTDDETLD